MSACEKCGSETLDLGCGRHYCSQCNHETRESVVCQNCGKREATENWVGEGGMLALTHGMYSCWCKICCLEAQLKYMREIVARIPETEAELAALRKQEAARGPEGQ
jgi:RNA polymerase subunit RPABC4/transcription elongation factor Spt4